MKKISIIGAGPVGLLLALKLCSRGYRVEIFERRPDMRKNKLHAGRSINITLSHRGIFALSTLGIEDKILKRATPLLGRMIHDLNNESSFQPYGKNSEECLHSISRAELNCALLDAVEKEGLCKIYFSQRLESYDFEKQLMYLRNEITGRTEVLGAECVIGSDGSASALRESMREQKGIHVENALLDYGYKELCIPARQDGSFQMQSQALHIWPREKFMLIAQPNFDGSFSCTLFLPFEGKESFMSLSQKNSAPYLRKFFQKYFGDATQLISKLEDSFMSGPTGKMLTVKVDRWNAGGQALLIGDAAHAIVPFYGQGLNCSFEDCVLLGEEIDRHGELERAFESFSTKRKPDCDAISQMALENFVEIRTRVGQSKFLLEKEIEKKLVECFPGDYIPRYSLVSFSRQPYRHALMAGQVQAKLLSRLSQGISSVNDLKMDTINRFMAEYRYELDLRTSSIHSSLPATL